MNKRENIIKEYFNCWSIKDDSLLSNIFDDCITYSECYGPKYNGLECIRIWFNDWNTKGNVLKWDIKQFIHQNNITVVEWYFKCEYKKEISEFNGISLIEFNEDNHIIDLKEFQSKLPHYYPYK